MDLWDIFSEIYVRSIIDSSRLCAYLILIHHIRIGIPASSFSSIYNYKLILANVQVSFHYCIHNVSYSNKENLTWLSFRFIWFCFLNLTNSANNASCHFRKYEKKFVLQYLHIRAISRKLLSIEFISNKEIRKKNIRCFYTDFIFRLVKFTKLIGIHI